MSVVEELGRTFQINEDGSVTRPYFVQGATTEPGAAALVLAYLESTLGIPPNIGGLVLTTIAGDEEQEDGYRCTATWGPYQKRPRPQTGESQFNFEIATQPVKVVVPIGTPTVYGPNPPLVQLIGDQGNGEPPEGVEVFEPVHSESETHYLPASAITAAYKQQIKKLVGKENSAGWKGHDAGEVLLSAVSGSRRGVDDWEVTFRWMVKENQSGLTIGGIAGITRRGWQYLWPIYETRKDPGGAAKLTHNITNVAVATVFRSGDMTLLGIGS